MEVSNDNALVKRIYVNETRLSRVKSNILMNVITEITGLANQVYLQHFILMMMCSVLQTVCCKLTVVAANMVLDTLHDMKLKTVGLQ